MNLTQAQHAPWRLDCTDHPNGGVFTEYPRIIHLLMDAEERAKEIATLPAIVGDRVQIKNGIATKAPVARQVFPV